MANYLYVNNSGVDFGAFHADIAASLKADGSLPEDLADLFVVKVSPVANDDGSPRYIIEAA